MDQAENKVQDPAFPAKDIPKENSMLPDMSGEDNGSKVNQSEYAEKLPLFSRQQIRKYMSKAVLLFLIIFLIPAGIFAYKKFWPMTQTPTPAPPPDENPIIPPPPEKQPVLLAYVKNQKEIWVADSNGENKIKAAELPPGSLKTFTALNWKAKDKIAYSSCEEKTGCDLVTIDLNDKSTSLEDRTKATIIRKFTFSTDDNYLAYITDDTKNTNLYLRTGAITSSLASFRTAVDETKVKSRVLFTKDNQYVVFSTLRKDLIPSKEDKTKMTELIYPIIYAFSPNGAKVDEIRDAADPFLVENNLIGYTQSGKFLYKEIGSTEFSEITESSGLQLVMSPDKTKIAYWKTDDEFATSVVLGLFETKTNIHRNIIRGVILPVWLSDDKLIGIKVDNCIGESCLLYEFKTASIGIIDINKGKSKLIDQGKSITEVSTNNAY